MFKSWSKIVLVSMLVIVIAAPAFATTARVRTMAGTGDYLSDDSNVFRWYSTLPSYANLVQAEMGSWYGGAWLADANYFRYYEGPQRAEDNGLGGALNAGQYDSGMLFNSRALGFNYACGEDGKWGTYRITLHENAVDNPGFYLVNPFIYMMSPGKAFNNSDTQGSYSQFNNTPVNKWDLAGGWEIGESFVLGVAYTRSSVKEENTTDTGTNKYSVSWTTIGVGGTWSNNDNMIIDASFTYATAGGETDLGMTGSPARNKYEYDKGSGLDFAARMFYDWKDYVTVIPKFEYATTEYALKASPSNAPAFNDDHGDKIMGLTFGAALDIEVNGSNTLIFAAEYNMGKWEASVPDSGSVDENSWSTLPTFRLALETEITSWLTTRLGAVHHNTSYTDKNGTSENKYTDDPDNDLGRRTTARAFEWFLGAGFNVAEWTIDLELAPETPFSLGYWLTGYSAWDNAPTSGYGPVGRISATYGF
jgi:hypothetical protein